MTLAGLRMHAQQAFFVCFALCRKRVHGAYQSGQTRNRWLRSTGFACRRDVEGGSSIHWCEFTRHRGKRAHILRLTEADQRRSAQRWICGRRTSRWTAVLLLHGWPYDIYSYVDVAPILAAAGYRVIVPFARGYGSTRFLSADAPRNGQQAALASDIIDLMDALKIEKAVIAGYDWVREAPTQR